ncbi:MAG: hypothetical protein WDN01_14675 [Rhizomicrobium sp.]
MLRGRPVQRNMSPLFLISPIGLALFSFIPLIFAYLVPSGFYESVLHEKDYVWSTPFMPIFFTLCVSSFVLGVISIALNSQSAAGSYRRERAMPEAYNFKALAYFLGAVDLLNIFSIFSILKNSTGMIDNLMSGNGDLVKLGMNAENTFSGAQPLLIAVNLWALFRYMQHGKYYKSTAVLRFVKYEIIASFLLSISIAVAKVARYEAIPLVIGFAVIFGYFNEKRGDASIWTALTLLAKLGAILTGIFVLFSVLRGRGSTDLLLYAVMGYGPACFNHLGALLEGALKFPYAGNGGYTFTFLLQFPYLHHFIDPKDLMGLPSYADVYLSEFLATHRAGLNSSFNWVTAFGYYYADLGNWVYLYLFVMGAIVGGAWNSFLKKRAYGIITYPFFASSVLCWFGFNAFSKPQLATILLCAIFVWMLEECFPAKRSTDASRREIRFRGAKFEKVRAGELSS